MIDLTGHHVLVVGGSRGIGAATATMAARAGAAVSITYASDEAAATRVVGAIIEAGGRASAHRADVADETAVTGATEAAVAELGPLTGLAVMAGVFEPAPLGEMTAEFWDRVMAVNLRGTFLATKAAALHLRRAGNGSVVIVSSTAGQRGSSVYSAYATSKGAQILFMRSMALELAPDVRVNCVAPAWTDTDMSRGPIDAIGRDEVVAGCPLGRIGTPEDVAGAVCFLLSDLASYVTGSTITVDGGQDMRG